VKDFSLNQTNYVTFHFSQGTYGTVWLTVAVEILNGPCYGFGYSAIVVYAGQLAPPGASTTVQSLANVCYECIGE